MIKTKVFAAAAALTLLGGMGAVAAAAGPASASTQTCNTCIHVQSDYAFRGSLDAEHADTAVNTPAVLWYETPSASDSGADFQGFAAGTVTQTLGAVAPSDDSTLNQSGENWYAYTGDTYIRLKYSPYGDNSANTYLGLDGTTLSLRADNPDSKWQEFIEVPVTAGGAPDGTLNGGANGSTGTGLGGTANACGSLTDPTSGYGYNAEASYCVLVDVGQTADPADPDVFTDPGNADTGSLVPQVVAFANVNQNGDYTTSQVWDFQN
jgi:hypothetical protein